MHKVGYCACSYDTYAKHVKPRSESHDQDEEDLKGTTSIGLTCSDDAVNGDELNADIDADHAVDMDMGYSTTGVVVCLARAPIDWKTVKDIRYNHVKSLVADKVVDVKYIKTGFQKADILTKSLDALKFI